MEALEEFSGRRGDGPKRKCGEGAGWPKSQRYLEKARTLRGEGCGTRAALRAGKLW